MILPGEQIDDLQRDGLVIIRGQRGFTYGEDAVLLSDFFKARPGDRAIDIGTGTGILAILCHAKTGAAFTAVDIQPELCDMARRSVAMNSLDAAICVTEGDIRLLAETLPRCSFDEAVCNPPYFSGGTVSPDPERRQSTHQGSLSLFDMAAASARLLKNGGRLFTVYPASGMAELFHALIENGLAPKRVKLISGKGGLPRLVLTESKKGAKPGGIIFESDI